MANCRAVFSARKTAGRDASCSRAVIAIELSIVGLNVLFNSWNNVFYNALQEHNWNAFVYQLGYFCILAAAFILLAVYQLYLNQWLQIRWRRWMTRTYLGDWLARFRALPHAASGRRRRQPRPAYRRRHPLRSSS